MATPSKNSNSIAARMREVRSSLSRYEEWNSGKAHRVLKQQMQTLQELREQVSSASLPPQQKPRSSPSSSRSDTTAVKGLYSYRGAA